MAATYTVKQVAEILGYSTNSIYTFIKEKRLEGVRIGKGRFRIPQSELDRLLLSSKKQPVTPSPGVSAQVAPIVQEPTGIKDSTSEILSIDRTPLFGGLHIATPNIFDWFVGLGAVISGIALFLFNQIFVSTNFAVPNRDIILSSLRILLIGTGIGVLLASVAGKYAMVWRRIFFIVLSIIGGFLTVVLWRSGDVSGAFTYGPLSFVLLLTLVAPLGGLASFSLYISIVAVTAVLVPIFGTTDVGVVQVAETFHMTPTMTSVVLVATGFPFVIALWWGYLKERKIFWFCTWIAAFVFFGLALFYAQSDFWSRAFFFVVTGITSMFAYLWEELTETASKREHVLLALLFGALCGVLVVGVLVVRILQMNVIETVKREDVQKVSYAKTRMELAVSDVKNSVSRVVTSQEFVSAVEAKDTAQLNKISRIMMDSNKNIRRIVILDSNGMGIHLYPFGTFDQPNLSFRDYFRATRDTGQQYVSDVFQAAVDQSRRQVVSVAFPIAGPGNAFMGVLVASLDLDAIGARLQQIGVPERGEYVTIVDKKGKYIVTPDSTLVGVQSDPYDPVRRGIEGESGVVEIALPSVAKSIVAYDAVGEHGWGIGVWSPLAYAYQLTGTATLSVFLLILACVIVSVICVQGAHFLWRRRGRGGSP